MKRFLRLARRALRMPPRRVARAAMDLARMRMADVRRRLADRLEGDTLAAATVARLLELDGPAALAAAALSFPAPDAVLPLEPSLVPADAGAAMRDAVVAAARQALEHRFDLLGSGPVRVDYGLEAQGLEGHRYAMAPGPEAAERQRRRMEVLLPGSAAGYDPVDWHVDFISGYRWDPGAWHGSVPIGHLPGVDVKVPWELARLQHAGALGLAWRLAPDTPEGQAAPAELVAQIVDFIAANPVRRGVNWRTAMDVALRAYAWLAGVALVQGASALTPAFRSLLLRALSLHGRHIEENLEYVAGYAGNHYLSNVLGLVALGAALPATPRTDRWLAFGLQELVTEMDRQVLPDGADYEGSSSYHGFVAEMFLSATAIAVRLPPARRARLAAVPAGRMAHSAAPPLRPAGERGYDPARAELFPPAYLDRLRRMAEMVVDLTGRDGLLPQTGDGDSGRVFRLAPNDPRDARHVPAVAGRLFDDARLEAVGAAHALHARLLVPDAVASALAAESVPGGQGGEAATTGPRRIGDDPTPGRTPLVVYPHAGLAVAREGSLRLTMQFARVPEGIPGGHFHNDLLAFEASWDGVPFVVDGGAYLYTPAPGLRNAFRATSAHSTVAVAGCEQRRWPPPEVSVFTVERDADVVVLDEAVPGHMAARVEYGDVRHGRSWRWTASAVVVEDTVEAAAPATWVLNLAPGVGVRLLSPGGAAHRLELHRDGRACAIALEGTAPPEDAEGFYAIGYGRRVPNRRIMARIVGGHCRATLRFQRDGEGETP